MFPDISQSFNAWVDRVVNENRSTAAIAYNFNLYEHEDEFAIQLVGTRSFNSQDGDWATDAAFTSSEDLFCLSHSDFGNGWRQGLVAAKSLVSIYLQHGEQAELMKGSEAVGVGFVDGDIEIVYARKN